MLTEGSRMAIIGTRDTSAAAFNSWLSSWRRPQSERTLDCDRRDRQVPLRLRLAVERGEEPETIGWLLLGPRPDGSFFGKDEREALEHVAGPIARALHITQLRQRREEQAELRLSNLERLVENLASGLDKGEAAAT